MAELHNLSPVPGSHRDAKRKGRGPASGNGKTAGRGQKGQNSRSGGKVSAGFEGGQMPLQRRIPKRGFHNKFRIEYQVVNVRDLDRVEAGEINPEVLKAAGLIATLRKPVKILGMGEVEKAFQITAHRFSGSARSKIEAAGGSVTLVADLEADTEAAVEAAPEADSAPEAEAAAEPVAEAAAEEAVEAAAEDVTESDDAAEDVADDVADTDDKA
jgi:large subunit ribosomal protein L15